MCCIQNEFENGPLQIDSLLFMVGFFFGFHINFVSLVSDPVFDPNINKAILHSKHPTTSFSKMTL